MKKSGVGARTAATVPTAFSSVAISDANVAQFITDVISLRLPRVRFSQGTGRAQFVMVDGLVAISQTRDDLDPWPYSRTQDGHTFPTFWKLWFVPMSEIEIEI